VSDPAATSLLERLGSPERDTQRRACDDVLARLRDDPALRPALLKLLRQGSPHARFGAAYVLLSSDGPSLRVLPALLEALELEDGDLRWSAAHLLALLGRSQDEVYPVLVHEATSGESARRRRMSLYVLRELGPERPATGSAFLSALRDPDPDVRRAALSSLAKLREPGPECLSAALEVLASDPDARMQRIAAVVLPGLVLANPERRDDALGQLRACCAGGDPSLVRAARAALERL
jgi:HEAT repeat protein